MLASWAQITGYFTRLAAASPKVRVDTLGPSTQGRPLVLVTISDPANLARRESIMAVERRLADPRTLDSASYAQALAAQPAVILIQCSIHSTEIGASQMSMELAWRLVTDSALGEDLRHVVVLLIPSPNPDGIDIVGDWYRASRGTAWDGTSPPWLYHAYVGHDDNRDWYMLTQAETRLVTHLLYHQWFPLVVYDVHQQSSGGMRMFVPPYQDPVNPNIDGTLVEAMTNVGTTMGQALADAGMTGVAHRQTYDLWWHGGAREVPARHNMIGILTEAASARIASPICLTQVRQPERGGDYPNPWTPGCWHLGDIVNYELITSTALVKMAADQREAFIARFVSLGRHEIAAGRRAPTAFLMPPEGDLGRRALLANVLIQAGVEVRRARAAFTANGRTYGAGTLVVPMDQPFRAHAKDLLERQVYPERRAYPGGPELPPYDVAGWTLPLQMGVRVDQADSALTVDAEPLDTVTVPAGHVTGRGDIVLLDNSVNAHITAVWRALAAGATVQVTRAAITAAGRRWPAGTLVIRGAAGRAAIDSAAQRLGFDAIATNRVPAGDAPLVRGVPRVGLYRSWNASMDEGWTRWVFEQLGVRYEAVTDSLMRLGDLSRRYDVVILPSESEREMLSGRAANTAPPQYTGGLGEAGAAALRAFVDGGGTVIAMDQASAFAVNRLGAPARVLRSGRGGGDTTSVSRFYAPGSIFETTVDQSHPIASGFGERTAVYFISSVILEAGPGAHAVLSYPVDRPVLLSGFLEGASVLAGKPALLDAPVGRGRVILFGFSAEHRGQAQGTFRLLTNAILYGAGNAPARAARGGAAATATGR